MKNFATRDLSEQQSLSLSLSLQDLCFLNNPLELLIVHFATRDLSERSLPAVDLQIYAKIYCVDTWEAFGGGRRPRLRWPLPAGQTDLTIPSFLLLDFLGIFLKHGFEGLSVVAAAPRCKLI